MSDSNSAWQLANDYVQRVDQRQFSAMSDILWPEFQQRGPGFASASAAEFIAGLELLRRYDRTFHQLGSQFGRWRADRYEGESYCVASHFYGDDSGERRMDMGIRYLDVIERRGGLVKYLSRDIVLVWSEDRPYQPVF